VYGGGGKEVFLFWSTVSFVLCLVAFSILLAEIKISQTQLVLFLSQKHMAYSHFAFQISLITKKNFMAW